MEDATKPTMENGSTGGLNSLSKVAHIPIVECTLSKASEMYSKLKGASETVNSVLTSAENTVKTAAQKTQPVTQTVTSKLEGPIKKVDSVLCSGIDFVEEKIPAIKLQPGEMAQKTKDALNTNVVEPAIKGMTALGEYGKQTVASFTAGYSSKTPSPDSENK